MSLLPSRLSRQVFGGMDELAAAAAVFPIDIEPLSSSGAGCEVDATTMATDASVDDKGEPRRPNSNRRIAEPVRGNESTAHCSLISLFI